MDSMTTRLLLVGLGGALGSMARYGVILFMAPRTGTSWGGTLLVNVLGSFALGFLMELGMTNDWLRSDLQLFLRTGVLGGFTTYSTFNFETTEMLRTGAGTAAVLNVLATVAGCLLAGVLGLLAARLVTGR
jgi:CrcB protein